MIGIDPVTLGDVTCSRPSPKYVWDRNGTLVQVPPDTLAVTYDPSDLSKAPYALIEPSATNLFTKSNQLNDAAWAKSGVTVSGAPTDTGIDGVNSAFYMAETATNAPHEIRTPTLNIKAGDIQTETIFAKAGTRTRLRMGFSSVFGPAEQYAVFDLVTGVVALNNAPTTLTATIKPAGFGFWRCRITSIATKAATGTNYIGLDLAGAAIYQGDGVSGLYLTRGQHEATVEPSSVIDTDVAPATRAADVIAPGAGLVYSNVPITEPNYDVKATYVKGAVVHDPMTHFTYTSLIDANIGNPLSDKTKWNKETPTNRWRMLDQYNNTRTTAPDEILIVIAPKQISRGLFLGNLDANDWSVSVVDRVEGLVYSETQSLVVKDSGGSFFKWLFNRITRKTYGVTVKLPVYYDALITISIRKIGSTPGCGMCVVGPVEDFGLTLWGVSTDLKDFSTTKFNVDGTSETTERGYSKRMSIDMVVPNERIDAVEERLAAYKQRVIAWLGIPRFGSTCIVGRYTSFKKVIPGTLESKVSLQIEGTVQ